MKAKPGRPMFLFFISGVVFCLSIIQAIYFLCLPVLVSSRFEPEISQYVWIFAKFATCIYLVIGCVLIFRGQRLGVYLVELAVLYSLLYYIWMMINGWYSLDEAMRPSTAMGWLAQIAVLVVAVSGHLFYLWCLRNEKAILYFDLVKPRDT